jgi:hypothetical protein
MNATQLIRTKKLVMNHVEAEDRVENAILQTARAFYYEETFLKKQGKFSNTDKKDGRAWRETHGHDGRAWNRSHHA